MKALIVAIVLALGVLLLWLAKPAHAALCGFGYEAFRAGLDKKYQETPRGKGIAIGTAIIVQIFRSPRGTFTILTIEPDGRTCVMAAGVNWEDIKPEIPGEKL